MADSVTPIMRALANQIETQLRPAISDLQVWPMLLPTPTPPTIDVFPASPFVERITYGMGESGRRYNFTVRARVTTGDSEAGQLELLSMMDPESAASVEAAILSDRTLGSACTQASVEGPGEYELLFDLGTSREAPRVAYVGCTWRVGVLP